MWREEDKSMCFTVFIFSLKSIGTCSWFLVGGWAEGNRKKIIMIVFLKLTDFDF